MKAPDTTKTCLDPILRRAKQSLVAKRVKPNPVLRRNEVPCEVPLARLGDTDYRDMSSCERVLHCCRCHVSTDYSHWVVRRDSSGVRRGHQGLGQDIRG